MFFKKYLCNHRFYYLLACLIFSTFFIFVSFNNRLVPGDDYFFYSEVIEKGIFQSLIDFNFNTRISSFFIFNVVFCAAYDFETLPNYIFIYHLIFLFSWSMASFFFLKTIIKDYFSFENNNIEIFIYSMLFNLGLFFFVPDLIETWFWVIGSTVYGIPIIASIFGFTALIKKKTSLLNYIILCLSFLVVAGALETLAISNLLVLSLLLIAGKNHQFGNKFRLKCSLSIFIIIVVLSINFLSGANIDRVNHEWSNGTNPELLMTGIDFLNSFIDKNNIVPALVLCSFFLLGIQLGRNNFFMQFIPSSKYLLGNIFILLLVMTITIFPMFLIFESWGVKRAWLPFHLYVYISLVFWSIYLGNKTNFNFNTLWVNSFIAMSLCALILFNCFQHFNKLIKYSDAHDKIIQEIQLRKKNNLRECMSIESLPEVGYIVNFEIDHDSLSSHNMLLKRAVNSNFYFRKVD